MREIDVIVTEEEAFQRIDKYISEKEDDLSRSRVQQLLQEGIVCVNGNACKANYKIKPKDHITAVFCDEIEMEAIEVSMNYGSSTAVPVSQKAPEFSELRFAHIRGNHAAIGVSLCGLPESPLREITLEDVSIAAEDPLREEYVEK